MSRQQAVARRQTSPRAHRLAAEASFCVLAMALKRLAGMPRRARQIMSCLEFSDGPDRCLTATPGPSPRSTTRITASCRSARTP
eukprot:scaffold138466_cov42-Prasinocladus_malaysianus.AAC.1